MIWPVNLAAAEPAGDPRVRRSRAALLRAALEVVTERGTADVSVSDIARVADVSRRVLYQHFGDRDALLLEAGFELVRRDLLPGLQDRTPQAEVGRERALAVARHFAEHRVYYRALLTGSCALALERGLISLLLPVNRHGVELLHGDQFDSGTIDDFATFLAGGATVLFTTWVVDGPDPLDPEAFTDRLLHVVSRVLPTAGLYPATSHAPDSRRIQ